MTALAIIQGRIASPELKFTQQNKSVLELRICATRRAKDKQTGEWGDDGAPLWLSATFWEAEADRLADSLAKGDTVTIQGDLVVEEYQTRDGGQGSKLVVRFPRFLGVVPKQAQQQAHQFATAANNPGPVPVDPWTTQGPQTGTQAGFGGAPNVAPF